jgi:hypothetical protein
MVALEALAVTSDTSALVIKYDVSPGEIATWQQILREHAANIFATTLIADPASPDPRPKLEPDQSSKFGDILIQKLATSGDPNKEDDLRLLDTIKTWYRSISWFLLTAWLVVTIGFKFTALVGNSVVALDLYQAVVAAIGTVVLLSATQPPAPVNGDEVRPALAERQLWKYWILLWCSWVAVYLALAASDAWHEQFKDVLDSKVQLGTATVRIYVAIYGQRVLTVLPEAINCVSTLLFVCMYVAMTARTVSKQRIQQEYLLLRAENPSFSPPPEISLADKFLNRSFLVTWWSLLFAALFSTQLGFLIWNIGNIPQDVPPDKGFHQIDTWFAFGYGALAAMAMSMFFGRLGSISLKTETIPEMDSPSELSSPTPPRRKTGVGPMALAILFGYAAIQPAYILVADTSLHSSTAVVGRDMFLMLFLIGKVTLFWVMARLLRRRMLRFYVTETPGIVRHIDAAWAAFSAKNKALPFELFSRLPKLQ